MLDQLAGTEVWGALAAPHSSARARGGGGQAAQTELRSTCAPVKYCMLRYARQVFVHFNAFSVDLVP